jgi:predicted amidohydrolase
MYKPIRVLSLGFRDKREDVVWNRVLGEAADFKPDIVLLPEAWLGDEYPKHKCDAVLSNAAEVAQKLGAYIVCPLYRLTPKGCRNSSFVLDSEGALVSTYDKMFPWWYEFSGEPKCESGEDVRPIDTKFGILSPSICFDVNFPRVWARMEEAGTELVLWSSDYSAGRALQAHAITHHYYIATATRFPDTAVYDISGDELSYNDKPSEKDGIVVTKTVLDMDRQIFHHDFNLEKRDALLKKYPNIIEEKNYERERWFILASRDNRQSVKDAAREFEMEPLRDYIRRSGQAINKAWS